MFTVSGALASIAGSLPMPSAARFANQIGPGKRTLHTLHKPIHKRVYGASVPGSIRRRKAREAQEAVR